MSVDNLGALLAGPYSSAAGGQARRYERGLTLIDAFAARAAHSGWLWNVTPGRNAIPPVSTRSRPKLPGGRSICANAQYSSGQPRS